MLKQRIEQKKEEKKELPPIRKSALAHLSDNKKEREAQKKAEAVDLAAKRQEQMIANQKAIHEVWHKMHTAKHEDHLKICEYMQKHENWDSMEDVLAKIDAINK